MAVLGARTTASAGDWFVERGIIRRIDGTNSCVPKGLQETGYIENQNVTIEYRFAEDQIDRLPALAAELVRRQVTVIATAGEDPAFAAKAATTTIPIVFATAQDPVKLGLVASLAHPGGNVTGVNFFATEVAAKRLSLLRELVPRAKNVAVLVNPATTYTTETTLRDLQAAAPALGIQLNVFNAATSQEIDTAFANLVRERADALFVSSGGFFTGRRVQLERGVFANGQRPRYAYDHTGGC